MGETETEVVFESSNAHEIAMVRQLLEGAGIPSATSASGNHALMSVLGGGSFAGVSVVQVPAEFADRAFELLEQAFGRDPGPDAQA